jgi:hypothetical protein
MYANRSVLLRCNLQEIAMVRDLVRFTRTLIADCLDGDAVDTKRRNRLAASKA